MVMTGRENTGVREGNENSPQREESGEGSRDRAREVRGPKRLPGREWLWGAPGDSHTARVPAEEREARVPAERGGGEGPSRKRGSRDREREVWGPRSSPSRGGGAR